MRRSFENHGAIDVEIGSCIGLIASLVPILGILGGPLLQIIRSSETVCLFQETQPILSEYEGALPADDECISAETRPKKKSIEH